MSLRLKVRKLMAEVQSYWETRHLRSKMRACEETNTRYYGGEATIHNTNNLDVEVDRYGNVVSVWFRCQRLPFKQVKVDANRALEMRALGHSPVVELHGVEVRDARIV